MQPFLILASASPRRTSMLEQIGIPHRQLPVDIDEAPHVGESPQAQVTRLAVQKANEAFRCLDETQQSDAVVLAADTLIAFNGKSLGKPVDEADCRSMLKALSGNEHEVLTAISVKSSGRQETQCLCTKVRFASLSEADIAAYWQTGEPADKAGSYAIQGIGGQFVKSVEGSVSAVIGLPLYETKQLLKTFGVVS
ncbi:septum formation inhibitor Maf [Alteromonas pelagimontana]|uniref:dTTP/UTP pyrophosphatase n=1 Tax=Alteromonas pelagimontana TaxID=1858656 RepID=A0A6M4MDW0_9ALTE|nr:Maf family protein [Alteromonas pelagimontana]QJR81292.1 septum formation inhibitor Maf [Alteromonas pelagimontana]